MSQSSGALANPPSRYVFPRSYMDFRELPDDAFFVTFSMLDVHTLNRTDMTCKMFRSLNKKLGIWRLLGTRRFAGIEIDDRGIFEEPTHPVQKYFRPTITTNVSTKPTPLGVRRNGHGLRGGHRMNTISTTVPSKYKELREANWKLRYAHFARDVYQFRAPFDGKNISTVTAPDEVAYTKCRFRADILTTQPSISIYLEVEVQANADNLSLAIVDFDEGGKSSVTFSPDTGAVIKETKIQEAPRRVKGAYIQPVKPNFTKFEGKVGIYVKNGQIAFFRQYAKQKWETTGFCVDFSWARGHRLTPCLAFRDEGTYMTKVTKVSHTPPFEPRSSQDAFDKQRWKELNWEGGPAM